VEVASGHSSPFSVDLDGDGDEDLLVGNNEGTIQYYENVKGVFIEKTGQGENPFHGIDVGVPWNSIGRSKPFCYDTDDDGDIDCLVGDFWSKTITHLQNLGNRTSPSYSVNDWVSPFAGVGLGWGSSLLCYDVDGDGDVDCLNGEYHGIVNYFEDIGQRSPAGFFNGYKRTPVLVEKLGQNENPFDAMTNLDEKYATPYCGDFDGDGDHDCLIGGEEGKIRYFENLQTGSLPLYSAKAGPENPFMGLAGFVGMLASPGCADMDGDGLIGDL